VFAVPGSIQSFKSTGTHTLIKQGAKLVEHAQDIIEELAALIQFEERPPEKPADKADRNLALLSDDEIRVFKALEPYPVHIDDLARKISMDVGRLSSVLLKLELNGLVQQAPGKLFCICEQPDADGR
jgi:DNA processing protein